MEHTKGKIETKEEDHQHVGIYPENNTNCLAVVWSDDMFNAEANAKELVRRWNAFEKDGLVDELRKACEAAGRFIRNGIGLGYINMPEEQTDPAHTTLPKIEAAIAKVS